MQGSRGVKDRQSGGLGVKMWSVGGMRVWGVGTKWNLIK